MSTENEKGAQATAPTANTGVPKEIPVVTKVIYTYDKDSKVFTGSDFILDSQELTEGQTVVEPEQGLYQPMTFDGTKWVGTDKDAYDAEQEKVRQEYLKDNPIPLTKADEQIAQLQKLVMSQSADLAKLKKDLADSTVKEGA